MRRKGTPEWFIFMPEPILIPRDFPIKVRLELDKTQGLKSNKLLDFFLAQAQRKEKLMT